MSKLNFLGIGPKMAIILLPWMVITIVLSNSYKNLFDYTSGDKTFILTTGIVLMSVGLVFYFSEPEKFFGEHYLKYKNSTPEFFPFL